MAQPAAVRADFAFCVESHFPAKAGTTNKPVLPTSRCYKQAGATNLDVNGYVLPCCAIGPRDQASLL